MENVAEFKKRTFTSYRFAALTIVSLAFAVYAKHFDQREDARIDSMTPAQYIAHQHHLHSHPLATHFFTALCLGVIYFAVVESIAFVLSRIARGR